ncbi:MAG: hypothetical protein H6581_18825 [Bacteroidia bacterium]|nr:hypothetical protein [Bacteroidia bacterium]
MKKLNLLLAVFFIVFTAQITLANGPADSGKKESKKTTTFVETVSSANQLIYKFQTPELSLQSIQTLTDITNLLFLVANPDVNGFFYNPETQSFSISCKAGTHLDTDAVSAKLSSLITQKK